MAQITGDSPQAVAFALLEKIAINESWSTGRLTGEAWDGVDRGQILGTYAQCLAVVMGTLPTGPVPLEGGFR